MGRFVETAFIVLLFCVSGCASNAPKDETYTVELRSTDFINPDASGRASPILVKLLALRSTNQFSKVDFFKVFDDPATALQSELVSASEITLLPSSREKVRVKADDTVEYIGVVAGFQDIDSAIWRAQSKLKGVLRNRTVRFVVADKTIETEE